MRNVHVNAAPPLKHLPEVDVVSHFSHVLCYLQVSEAILDNARLMLQTENIQANAEDFKDRSEVTHTHTQNTVTHWLRELPTFLLQI